MQAAISSSAAAEIARCSSAENPYSGTYGSSGLAVYVVAAGAVAAVVLVPPPGPHEARTTPTSAADRSAAGAAPGQPHPRFSLSGQGASGSPRRSVSPQKMP